MGLIGRYVLRESFASTLLVMVVLLVIFMSNQFAEILGDAAADDLPREAVMTVFSLTFWRYLTFLAPIGVLLGVLLALARFNRDSEAAALAACGYGPGALLKPIGVLSVAAAAGVGWLALVTAPEANRTIAEIRFNAREQMEVDAVTPGSFTSTESGSGVLYAREADGNVMKGVFWQREQEDRVIVVLAEQGERVQDRETGELSLLLRNGRRYEGVPGESRYSVVEFGEHLIPIRVDDEEFAPPIEAESTAELLSRADAASRAELEWRLATPLSTLLLVLLAVPLSRSSPREGRYGRVGIGVLLYLIYANSLSLARIWVERGLVPEWLGMWWVHAALAALALTLLVRESGILARPTPFRSAVGVRHEPAA